MKKVNKLKDDARRHELREDWDKAIQAYQRVLEMGEREGEVDLPLYNRIGDLYVRVGKPNDAVRYYSQAADRYADAGLSNNAIALCNKALRYAPENLDLLRKLGQFSAAQGFLTDARRWFLDYAEHAARQSRMPEALQALEDFANSTEDAEVREMYGRTLQQHGKPDRAVSELRHAYRMYLGAGEHARAESLAAYLREIAPDVSLADEQPEAPHVRAQEDVDYVIRPYANAPETAPAPASSTEPAADDAAAADDVASVIDRVDDPDTLEGLEGTALGGPDAGTVEALEADVLEGFQPTSFETAPEDEIAALEAERIETAGATAPDEADTYELPGLEPTALDGAQHDEHDTLDAPDLTADADDVDDADDAWVELPTLDGDDADDAWVELPTLDADDADDASVELPTLDDVDDADDARVELPTLDGDDADAAFEVADDADGDQSGDRSGDDEDAAFELPFFAVDEIELPTFDDTAAAVAGVPDVAAAGPAETGAAVTRPPATEPDEVIEPESAAVAEPPATEPDVVIEPEPAVVAEPQRVAFHPPALSTDGVATADAEPPVIEVDRPDAALASVIAAARSAIGRDDVAGAVGRLLSLHQVLDDASAYGHAAEEVRALLIEKPKEIRLHQVHVEMAERSGDHTLRLGAYLLLARALEESQSFAKATAIYEHVLEIEPGNAAARDALAALERRRTSQYVDLKSLLELDRPSGETRYFVTEDSPTGDEDSDFAAVLSQFKAKLAEHVAPEDAEAHYDLGLAFKEMGLLDEAIEQFQVALRTGDGRLRVYEELGDCFVQKGEYSVAVKLLERAIQIPAADEMDRVGLYYYLGAASEQLGRADQARDAYERVLGLDMTFRDVAERLARL